ncbi:MAG: hypothetical protein AAFR61_23955 [Bacteroidota bacterium]
MHQILEEIAALELAEPLVGHRFSFADLPKAVQAFQTGETVGKVVVEL